ncbi:MAG: hypothetical protein WC498_03110 [Candidatus Saccharimonadales bacterium]
MTEGGNSAHGFTIVETLIVLAVTSALLLSAMLLINGRQNKTQFQTSINNLQQQIQQIINETSSGFYPNGGNVFSCTSTSGAAPIISSAAPNEQGTNGDCVFLGKAIRFGGGSNETFTVYPIAGNRLDIAGKEVTTLAAAHPTVIATGSITNATTPEVSTTFNTEGGLSFVSASYNGGALSATPPISAIAFVGSLGSYDTATKLLNSGAQQLSLYGFGSGTYSWSSASAGPTVVDAMNKNGLLGAPYSTVGICFASGTTNQSGLLTIGNNGSLGVGLRIFQGATCS